MASADQPDSLSEQLNDIVATAKAYVVQETVGPLRGLGRFIGRGLAGAFLMGIGLVLLLLALLRGIQNETYPHLTGNWSWAPYAIVLVVAVAIAALAATRIAKHELNTGKGRS
ncbi:MAG: hypothetical protein JWL70_1290 [Acidimicrobiia bacterium]|nr:hypothetical protein [Acidimicrobiia bacterium]